MKETTLQKVSLGGSLLAAITASLCCIGPLVAVALGAGGFAASALFDEWRPIFLGVTFTLLALAWYLTYRKPKGACADSSTCAARPVSKWSKIVLWMATAVVIATAAFPRLASAFLKSSRTEPAAVTAGANATTLRVTIPGMDCAACAASIQKVLQQPAGVLSAQVSFDTKLAEVRHDTNRISSVQILTAIGQTGFKAEPAKD